MKCPALDIVRASSIVLFDVFNSIGASEEFELPGSYDLWQDVSMHYWRHTKPIYLNHL